MNKLYQNIQMDEELLRRVERKVALSGLARVHAPDEGSARQWADTLTDQDYAARVEQGEVDALPAWIVVVDNR